MLWEALKDRFSDKPGVAFELLNEVRDVGPEKWNILAGKTVNALRRKNKERKLIIGAETLAFSGMYGVFTVLAQWLYTVTLGNKSPHEATTDKSIFRLMELMGLHRIPADEINLTPTLLKR